METIRRIRRDRFWNGTIAVALAYLVVLQTLVATLAQTTMAATAAGPQNVICTSTGVVSVDPQPDDNPPERSLPQHCLTLCQLGSMASPALLGGQSSISYPLQLRIAALRPPPDWLFTPFIPRSTAEARAPPLSV